MPKALDNKNIRGILWMLVATSTLSILSMMANKLDFKLSMLEAFFIINLFSLGYISFCIVICRLSPLVKWEHVKLYAIRAFSVLLV